MSDTVTSRPVALVHGLGGSTATTWQSNGWLDLIGDAGRPVIGIDLLGHGDAAKPHEPHAYEALHTHVLDTLPEEPVDAIGFSLGARTLLECAIEEPTRFARLVLMGVGANLFERRESHERIAAAIRGEADPSDPFNRYFTDIASDPDADPLALQALIARPGSVLDTAALKRVAMPVLVLLGDNDFAGPASPLVDALPDVRHVELKRCDHFATPRSMQALDEALAFVEASPF